MIELKVDEEKPTDSLEIEFTEEQKKAFEEFIKKQNDLIARPLPPIIPCDDGIAKELHELNKTLKEILREMRKRKI